VEETGVPRENSRPTASHWQTLSHNVASSTPHLSGGDRHLKKGYSEAFSAVAYNPFLKLEVETVSM
jgi:hypothetical protein